jgi:uncharacterized protein
MLTTYLKYKHPAIQLLILLGTAFLLSQLAGIVAALIVNVGYGIGFKVVYSLLKGDAKHAQLKAVLVIFQATQFFFFFLATAFVYAYYADEQPNKYLGLDHFAKKHFFTKTIALVFLGFLAMGFLALINQLVPLSKATLDLEKKQSEAVMVLAVAKNIPDLIGSIILVGLFAAVGEELFFRGVLQRILIQWTTKPWLGIVITGILFSAIHLQFSGFLPRMGLGILLGFIYWYSGSMWVNILFHFLFNSMQVILAYLKPESVKNDTPISNSNVIITVVGLISTIAIVFILNEMRKRSTTKYAEVYPEKPGFFE